MLRFAWIPAMIAASLVILEADGPPSPSPSNPFSRPVTREVLSDLAPADEYFGKMRLSVVRIHHQVFALKDDLHHRRQRIATISHEADDIGDAYYDWAHHFPKDRWVPRTGWELATLYEELPGPDARDRALALLSFVRDHYAQSAFGDASVRELARGIGVRPWPRWASAPAPASNPSLAAGPSAAPSPKVAVRLTDAKSLLSTINALEAHLRANRRTPDPYEAATSLEEAFRRLSRDGADGNYDAAAWELGALYQLLPGEEARTHAIRMLALVLDRYSNSRYAAWSLRDLERGIGVRR